MRYLLDTCTAVWFFEGSARISPRLRDALTDPANDVLVSDVSLLELVIKYQLGRCPLPKPPSVLLPELIHQHGLAVLPLSTQHVYAMESLPLLHRDPFDRLLVAQSRFEHLTLATPDPLITPYDVHTVW